MPWAELDKVSYIRHKVSSSVYRTGCVCFWCLQPQHVVEEVIKVRVVVNYSFYVMRAGETTSDLLRFSWCKLVSQQPDGVSCIPLQTDDAMRFIAVYLRNFLVYQHNRENYILINFII